MVSVTNLILRFGIVQNKFQQKNKTEINHIIDSHIKFEVSLHFLGNWPTVCHGTPGTPRDDGPEKGIERSKYKRNIEVQIWKKMWPDKKSQS